MMLLSRSFVLLALTVLVTATPAAAASTPAAKCQTAIAKGSSAFVQVWVKAEQKCRDGLLKGKLPAVTDCESQIKVVTAAGKSTAKLRKLIAKACGGKDKVCGTGDTGEVALADIGWNIGTCPGFDDDHCTNAIANCNDVATCVRCVGDISVDQALELAYDSLTASDPKTQKSLNKCQASIGKAMTKLVATKSKTLAKCWSGVLAGKITAPCPDAKAAATIAAAATKKDAAIVKACQGPDKALGTGDDFTPAAIGFPATCLDAAVPSCAGNVTTLQDLITCVDCVAEHDIDCADAAALPGLVTPYPTSCNPNQSNIALPGSF